MVLYRKYRPQKFSDLVGQEAVTKTLLSQLTSGKIGHAYLFSGPKGTGKTSTARILAKAVNCEVYGKDRKAKNLKYAEPCNKCQSCTSIVDGSNLDLVEIDAASNRNIDDVRDIREKIKTSPVASRFKVYIVDEVHMLTKEAFNAFLKTLEEPPAHAIFILCTTEVSKLPATILSRVQKFSFKVATRENILTVLGKVAKAEGIKLDGEAAAAIAKSSEGSFRDAISLLDQLSSLKTKIATKDVEALAISSDETKVASFLESLAALNFKKALEIIEAVWSSGGDISLFTGETILFLEKVLFTKLEVDGKWDLDSEALVKIADFAQKVTSSYVQNLIRVLLVAEGEMKLYPLPHISLVLAICKLMPEADDREITNEVAAVPKEELSPEAEKKELEDKKERTPFKVKAKSLKKIEGNWANFIDEVRHINNHIAAVLRSTRPLSLEGDILTLGVYFRFHKDKLEEPKTLALLEEALSQMTGAKTRIKFIVEEKGKDAPTAVKESDLSQVENSELEAMAAEIFSK